MFIFNFKKTTTAMSVAAALCAIMLTGCGNEIPKDAQLIYEKLQDANNESTARETFIRPKGDKQGLPGTVLTKIYGSHHTDPIFITNNYKDPVLLECEYKNNYKFGIEYSKVIKNSCTVEEKAYLREEDEKGVWLNVYTKTYEAGDNENHEDSEVSYLTELRKDIRDVQSIQRITNGESQELLKYDDSYHRVSEYKDEYIYRGGWDCGPVLFYREFICDFECPYFFTYKYDESGKLNEYTVWPIKDNATFDDLKRYQVEYDKKAKKISIIDIGFNDDSNKKVAVYEYTKNMKEGYDKNNGYLFTKCSFGTDLKETVWVEQKTGNLAYYSNSDTFPPYEQILWDRFGCNQYSVFE